MSMDTRLSWPLHLGYTYIHCSLKKKSTIQIPVNMQHHKLMLTVEHVLLVLLDDGNKQDLKSRLIIDYLSMNLAWMIPISLQKNLCMLCLTL